MRAASVALAVPARGQGPLARRREHKGTGCARVQSVVLPHAFDALASHLAPPTVIDAGATMGSLAHIPNRPRGAGKSRVGQETLTLRRPLPQRVRA